VAWDGSEILICNSRAVHDMGECEPATIRELIKRVVPEFEYNPDREETALNSKLVS